jgi:hypothetical protein
MAVEGEDALGWRCSSFCNGGSCVEVGLQADAVALRNSADPARILTIPVAGWRAFVRDCKEGLIPSGT